MSIYYYLLLLSCVFTCTICPTISYACLRFRYCVLRKVSVLLFSFFFLALYTHMFYRYPYYACISFFPIIAGRVTRREIKVLLEPIQGAVFTLRDRRFVSDASSIYECNNERCTAEIRYRK